MTKHEKSSAQMRLLFKDAFVLTLITLIAGFALAMVYQVTKEPIATQAYEKKMNAYKTVFASASSFDETDDTKAKTDTAMDILAPHTELGKVGIEEVLQATDENAGAIGYVATAYSDEGYGGRIRISVGYDTKAHQVTRVAILEASETAGLGAKIFEPAFHDQYAEKSVAQFKVVKGSATSEDEIQALSGATISSRAVTNAVNAALLVFTEGGTQS